MGDTRDRLKGKAEQAAREQAEKGKEVAESAAKAAKKEASAEAERQDLGKSSDAKEGEHQKIGSARASGTPSLKTKNRDYNSSPTRSGEIKDRN